MDTNQGNAACATVSTSVSRFNNTIGKNWGAGVTRIVSGVTVYGPVNGLFVAEITIFYRQ